MVIGSAPRMISSREAFNGGVFCFFNDPATTEIYTLSLHDALPISSAAAKARPADTAEASAETHAPQRDRKSTRLNSSHTVISYAVFCLKKKKKKHNLIPFKIKKKKKQT